MDIGFFYFISDNYFIEFPDKNLMQNKDYVDGKAHDRPCFLAFSDSKVPGLYWMVPISSKVEKYSKIYNSKILKYGKCDTIVFGEVLGRTKTFLIQNMCPLTNNYINACYTDNLNKPVRIDKRLENEVVSKAQKVLALERNGKHLIFPDIFKIEKALINQLQQSKNMIIDTSDSTIKSILSEYTQKNEENFESAKKISNTSR